MQVNPGNLFKAVAIGLGLSPKPRSTRAASEIDQLEFEIRKMEIDARLKKSVDADVFADRIQRRNLLMNQ